MRSIGLLPMALMLMACEPDVSQGLKIFVSSRGHLADFANDPSLTGDSGIAKADSFCNTDPAKPGPGTYKALLVDGVNRDAVTAVDWVLKPDTAYYRPHDDILIDTTTAAAVFDVASRPLASSIRGATLGEERHRVWTGLASAANFSSGDDCNDWSNATNLYSAFVGTPEEDGAGAFVGVGGYGCAFFELSIYCVEQ